MTVLRLQVALDTDTLAPEDVITNTWHVETPDDVPDNVLLGAADAADALEDFYVAIGGIFASAMAGTGLIKVYDLADIEPRVPLLTLPVAFTPGGGGMPGEVAICLSFKAAMASGAVPARNRGRVFLGRISSDINSIVTGGMRPSAAGRTTIANAAAAFLAASDADTTWTWIVFSPTSAGPQAQNGTYFALLLGARPVVEGWVDDAYDTIRSRGLASAARTLFT